MELGKGDVQNSAREDELIRYDDLLSRPTAQSPMTENRPARRARRAEPWAEQLAPEATVNFAAERNASGIGDVLAALDGELVGLAPVKKRIQEVAALLLVSRVRQRFGLLSTRPNLHMCFTGAPGVGKTTVGMRMAELLHRLGYLDQGHLVVAMRNDLVGEYIGHTAPKTKKVLDRAKGGVLFIDEAYYLHRTDSEKDYGQEAVEILLQVMENERDNLVVILAGYKNRMDAFFESNPGMSSRIAHHLDFADYELDELDSIGKLMLQQESYYLSEDAAATFREYLKRRMQQPRFANGRSVRNALERARLRHANRLLADPDRTWNRDDLMRIEPVDIHSGSDLHRPPGRRLSEAILDSVSCSSATACTAVGEVSPSVNASGNHVTLAERWNGTTWVIQPTPGNPAAPPR